MAKRVKPDDVREEAPVEAREVADEIQEGISVEDTALGNVAGDLAVVHSCIGLNLRAGPSINSPIKCVLEDGTVVAVLRLQGSVDIPEWMQIHTGECTGWVMSKYIEVLTQAGEA